MVALSWDDIVERGKQHNKTVICEVERCGQRYFKVKCNLCEIETVLRAYSFKSCLKCRTKSLYYIHFITKAYNRHAGKFDYSLTKYINSKTKVKIICKKCNIIFLQKPNDHLNGQGCPQCNESKGELRVTKYLSEKNIRFIPQKTFRTLRGMKPLKCDFYLEDLNLLVEYDGEYHFKAIRGSTQEQKQKNLENCQRRDKIKNEWALKNNIPLLRIPYWDFDRIEELIEAFILEHSRPKEIKQLVLEI